MFKEKLIIQNIVADSPPLPLRGSSFFCKYIYSTDELHFTLKQI